MQRIGRVAIASFMILAGIPALAQQAPLQSAPPVEGVQEDASGAPAVDDSQRPDELRDLLAQPVAPVTWDKIHAARLARAQATFAFSAMMADLQKEKTKRPLQEGEIAIAQRYRAASMEVQHLERQHALSFVAEKERLALASALAEAIQAGFDPRAAKKSGTGWTIKATPGERAATAEEAGILDRFDAALNAAGEMMLRGMASISDARIVPDAYLQGRTGSARPSNTPFLAQSVQFNRAYAFAEPSSIKWTFLDTQNNKPGDVLFPWRDRYCAGSVCFADDDLDGKFEGGYFREVVFNYVEIPARIGRRLDPPKAPAAYREIAAPEILRHEIGFLLDDVRTDKKTGKSTAFISVMMRQVSDKSWVSVMQPLRIDLGTEGKGAMEFMGCRVELAAAGNKSITWNVVRPIPEQPFDPTLTLRTGYRSLMTPTLR
jgi:hypothetical protein